MHVDAISAKGIVGRKGLSKVGYIDTDALWLQEQQARRVLPFTRVLGTENIADFMTPHTPTTSESTMTDGRTAEAKGFGDGSIDVLVNLCLLQCGSRRGQTAESTECVYEALGAFI